MVFEVVVGNSEILRREYLLSTVNMLTNSLKISDQTKTDFSQLKLSQSRGKVK